MKNRPVGQVHDRSVRRRTALQAVAYAMLAAPVDAQHHGIVQIAKALPSNGLRYFTTAQNELLDRLTELIIPADDHSPGAHEARVSLFIDRMVSQSEKTVQHAWTDDLAALEREAAAGFGKGFLACTAAEQDQMLASLAINEHQPKTRRERFFVRLKQITIDGYYTSPIGIHKDLHYQGNRVMASFQGCTHPEHR
jgi:hypothetical protein